MKVYVGTIEVKGVVLLDRCDELNLLACYIVQIRVKFRPTRLLLNNLHVLWSPDKYGIPFF